MNRIAVDVMGGDRGPETILDGALEAAREGGVPLALVGPEDQLRRWLAGRPDASALDLTVVHAPDAVGMGESPAAALRRRPGASIRVAAGHVASGASAALFSAGNTGATVVAAHAAFGRMTGVERPALVATVPTRDGSAVLLDVGANARCRASHLVQFAAMGAVYARLALSIGAPRVGLLSIGEEETKGNELTREVHRLLKASGLNFTGNIEARDVYAGGADVIVCDGFTGNIALKVSEGLVEMIGGLLRDVVAGLGPDLGPRVGAEVFGALERRVDGARHGAVPLLGLAGLALVGHGRSSSRAVRSGILIAHELAASQLVARLQEGVAVLGESSR
jgi:phosphate acyltransferase